MAKDTIRDFSATASANTDIQSVNVDENCAASGINNAIRELMADLKDVSAGTVALETPQADSLGTDTITEKTSAAGVTIDGVLLKDGAIGSIASAVAAHLTSINGGQIGGSRNLIINGAMQVAQRGTSAVAVPNGGYSTVDRMRFYESTGGAYTSEQSSDVPAGQGFSKSIKLACTTADSSIGAAEIANMSQVIEGQNLQRLNYGTSDAKTITLSFWVKSNKTGIYTIAMYKHAGGGTAYGCPVEYTISSANTWEKKTITVTPTAGSTTLITSSAGAIIDSNGAGIEVHWGLAWGSNYNSTNNTWSASGFYSTSNQVNWLDSTSNNFYITGIQLEVGTNASDFEHRSYGDELAACYRYFQRLGEYTTNSYPVNGQCYVYGGTNVAGSFQLISSMRASSPTVSFPNGNFGVRAGSAANNQYEFSSINNNQGATQGVMQFDATVASGIQVNTIGVVVNAGNNKYMYVDAEL